MPASPRGSEGIALTAVPPSTTAGRTGVFAGIGDTPLIELDFLEEIPDGVRLFAKLESTNPGGSIKDRPVARMLSAALRDGRNYVVAEDMATAMRPALRHRLLPSFEAEARGLTGDALVADVLHDLPELPDEVEAVLRAIDD